MTNESLYPNGWQNPVFQIFSGTTKIDSISLPECNADGFIETYEFIQHEKTIIDYELKHEVIGVRTTFTLNYNRYLTYLTWLKICKIWDYWRGKKSYANFKLILIPHSEVNERTFDVVYTGEPISIMNFRGAQHAQGAKLPVVKFKERRVSNSISVGNPNRYTFKMFFPFNLNEL